MGKGAAAGATDWVCAPFTHGKAAEDPLSHLSPRSGGKCQLPLKSRGAKWRTQRSPRWKPRCRRCNWSRIQPLSHAYKSYGRASSPYTGEPRARSGSAAHAYTSAHRAAARYLSLSLFAPQAAQKSSSLLRGSRGRSRAVHRFSRGGKRGRCRGCHRLGLHSVYPR